jgi:hypothetical protein
MQKFKNRWEIQHNWQLLFPILGMLGLLYAGYLVSNKLTSSLPIYVTILVAIGFAYLFLKITLFCFKKLENKWIVTYKWEMIRIFIVFAITGSSSALIGKPIMTLVGITKENLNPFVYWVLYIIIGLVFYQILLVFFGWLFGQFQFFWEFEKKMLQKMGFKRFIK